jgi:ATP-dependent DNA helicase RecG
MVLLPRLSELPQSVSTKEFWDIFGKLEHEQLELKTGTTHLVEPISAMAMTVGGLLIVGVSDNRTVVGCELTQKVLDRVTRAGHSVGVVVQPREIAIDGSLVVVVAVPEIRGRIVTTPDGRLLRRVGSENQPLVGDAMARFVRERVGHSAEDDALVLRDFSEFDLDLVNRALAHEGRPRVRRDGLVRALIDLGVALPAPPPTDPTVTKAAALLFAENPTKYVPGAAVQLVRRVGVGPGPGPTQARREVAGPLPLVLDGVMDFIQTHTQRFEAVIGARREYLAEYPTNVLREAVLNALAHRDYGLEGATVDVTIWDDRIEIRSPGSLPGHITLDNIRQEHYSRNRHVMQVLKLLALVEEYGEGVDRMYREMEARLMEPPIFTATPSSVTVELRNRSLLSVEDQAWLALLGHLDLSPQERRILVIARHTGGVTPRQIRAVMLDVDAEALLAGAVAKGLLVRTGERGGTRYELSDEVIVRAGAGGVEARGRQRQLLLDEIHRRGNLSTAEAVAFLEERDATTVRHLLNDLVRAGLAVAKGRTRARRYYPGG